MASASAVPGIRPFRFRCPSTTPHPIPDMDRPDPPHTLRRRQPAKVQLRRAARGLLLVAAASWLGLGGSFFPSKAATPAAFGGIQPALSPDGQTIAVSYQGAICRVPGGGGVLTQLTHGEGWDVEPAWSPDGKQIAYINAPNFGPGPLRMINGADGSRVALPKEVLARGRLQYHPDGRRLLGMFTMTGQPNRLQWFDLASGALIPIRITGLEAAAFNSMKWALSADGAGLLLTTAEDRPGEQDGNNGPSTRIWRVPSNGGEVRLLDRWPSRIYGLCWDAEGNGAFLVTDRGVAYNDIWHVSLSNLLGSARKITFGQADEDWPAVSADGRWLVHTENQQGATALTRLDLTSNEPHAVPISQINPREPVAPVRLVLKDAGTGESLAARISVKKQGGKFRFPDRALYRLTAGLGHFYARDTVELALSPGKYSIQAWHGPEYVIFNQEVAIAAGAPQQILLRLERWVNMPERGWFSGENHIHANYGYGAWHNNPETIRGQCEGEDLHVANVVVANSDGDGVFDRQYFLGRTDPASLPRTILYWNEEFRSTIWGHMTLGHLSQLVEPIFTGFKETTNPWDIPTNADIAERTRAQRGTVSYTHPASNSDSPYDGAYSAKGLPVDAALGRVDTADVMGFGYRATLPLWYRLLNCGFRIPAAAGTDVFLNRITCYPPGWGRCYVRMTNGLGYSEWMQNQRAGRSFVTSGPILEWTVDGWEAGSTLRLDAPRSVRLRARGASQFPMKSLEVIKNGVVLAAKAPLAGEREIVLDQEIALNGSAWLTVRCESGNTSFPGGPVLAAHGNPVYIELAGKAFDSRADAAFFLSWIDRLESDLKKRDRLPTGLDHVKMQMEAARAVYRKLAE